MATEEKQVVEETAVVPGKMEFRLISPTESNFLKHIEWNKEELLAAVRSKVTSYEGIVYTEETVKSAKNDRAELNNLVKAIDERRKKVKEVINQPYAEFEKELKEITDLIKKQSAEIDEQVKAFETAEKEEKKAKIMEAYEKAIGNLAEILPFSKVFDQRYLNKTCKLASAIAEVQKKIEQVKTDLETIESVCGKYKLNAKDVYVRTLDLSKAMAEEKRLKDLEEKLEAERIQKEKAAEERRKAEEARKAEAERIRTICVTAIGTLIIERVARKIYSEIKERYEARIEDRKNGFAYGKYLDNIAYAYGMKRKFFEPDKEFRARILEQIRGI